MLSQLELCSEMHTILIAHCRDRNIQFFSGFDIPSLDFLASLGAECFKIPSGEITNLPYLRHIAAFGKPLILLLGWLRLEKLRRRWRFWRQLV